MKKILLILSTIFSLLLPYLVLAQSRPPANQRRTVGDAGALLNQAVQPTGLRTDDVKSITGTVINRALQLVGLIFLILMVYGGIIWMTARGNDDKVKQAKTTVSAAIIGMVLVAAAYAISVIVTRLVVNN